MSTLIILTGLRYQNKIFAVFIIAMLVSCSCMAIEISVGKVSLIAHFISYTNILLFVTSVISIKQYFWPGDENRLPFHIFNAIFVVLFYSVSIPFLITERVYYEEYQDITPLGVISKFFFTGNINSIAQLVIIFSLVINVLYIRRYNRDYYEAGIGNKHDHDDEVIQHESAVTDEPNAQSDGADVSKKLS
ncbi:MAG: hypothetical protein K9G49_16645 [Taibaiella sp.]|nr:hypothetical protein [Taibaiella sp.]